MLFSWKYVLCIPINWTSCWFTRLLNIIFYPKWFAGLCPSTEFFFREKIHYFSNHHGPLSKQKLSHCRHRARHRPRWWLFLQVMDWNGAMMKHLLNKLGVFTMFREPKKKKTCLKPTMYIYIYKLYIQDIISIVLYTFRSSKFNKLVKKPESFPNLWFTIIVISTSKCLWD